MFEYQVLFATGILVQVFAASVQDALLCLAITPTTADLNQRAILAISRADYCRDADPVAVTNVLSLLPSRN